MKRLGNIYQDVYSIANLELAEKKARKGKADQPGVKDFDKNPGVNLFLIHESLLNKTYKTSPYTVFKVNDRKERTVYRLPYNPDRIVHHAVMNVLEKMFITTFTADTYSCIKGRGIHGASRNLRKALEDRDRTEYCLKLDIKKFYENVDHEILKTLVRRKIKDNDLLWLLDGIIDSAEGLPIGNYLSQYLANFYLAYFDHWIKQEKKVNYYFRYCDDIVILSEDKPSLHSLLYDIKHYLNVNLKLTVKENYQIFPVKDRGIDFVGYVHFHDCVYLRKSIKQNLARAAKKGNRKSIAAYYGWAKYCNSKHLLKKLSMTKFSDLGLKPVRNSLEGNKIDFMDILNKEIKVHRFKIGPSKYEHKGNGLRLDLEIELEGQKRVAWTSSGVLMETIKQIPEDKFPITTTIIKQDRAFIFT